jgi:hypothetical protein
MMNQFRWGNISNPKVYLCETNLRMISLFRRNFGMLAQALIEENKMDSAIMALDRCYEVIPDYQLSLSLSDLSSLELYYKAGAMDKGNILAEKIFIAASEEMDYFLRFPRKYSNGIKSELQNRKYLLYHLCDITQRYGSEISDTFKQHWDTLFPRENWDLINAQELMDED